jgi:Tol biopolymer transport system component
MVAAAAAMALLTMRPGLEAQNEPAGTLGLFTGHGDIGTPSALGAGSVRLDPAPGGYVVTGGGENIWAAADHFQFVWRRASGDVSLEALIEFIATNPSTGTPDPHRKACLMIRQSLDPDSPYVDAATHGEGLTSLQWRETKGGVTHEVQANVSGPARLKIEKRGDYAMMSFARRGEPALQPAGGAAKVAITGEYYIGLAVSAHNAQRLETVRFSDVRFGTPEPLGTTTTLINSLETINLRSKDRRVAYVVVQPQRIEAPNWFPDTTNTLYFNSRGKLYKVETDIPGQALDPNRNHTPVAVDLGLLTNINNDHGLTFDGKTWAFSDQSQTVNGSRGSRIYTMPVGGGPVKRLTENAPSYFHGWAPDGRMLAYCAQRDNNFDIYTISADGGAETRLTTNPGKDDGPEYSPDGQYIYFNSDRSGTMQIWRMKPDGSAQEQVTNDEWDNWFPHVSPNGQLLAFLSYERGVGDHPENKDVRLRTMNITTKATDELAKLFGGQGTINVASWSPNSQYLAFVSYQIVPAQ